MTLSFAVALKLDFPLAGKVLAVGAVVADVAMIVPVNVTAASELGVADANEETATGLEIVGRGVATDPAPAVINQVLSHHS